MKKLKSSLKLSRHDSLSPSITSSTSSISSASSTSFSSNSSSSNTCKFVRFAPQLTTVKSFHINDEPISISDETSPVLYPIDNTSTFSSTADTTSTPAKRLIPNIYTRNTSNNKNLWDFNFDDIADDFDLDYFDNYHITYTNTPTSIASTNCAAKTVTDTSSLSNFNNIIESPTFNMSTIYNNDIQASIINSNFDNYNNNNNNSHNHFESYDNIKVVNISLVKDNVIRGTVKVRNLQYEKFIQCKFTFDGWKQIHYIKANYSHSPTDYEDIFIFDIDLNSWKFFLHYHNLIDNIMTNNHNNLNLEFVCMYNINDTVYYDNNNYQNFILNLNILPKFNDSISSVNHNNNITTPTTTTTTSTTTTTNSNNNFPKNSNRIVTRKFSKDTDYYNESPLKHMFHTDTYWIHPKNQNKLSFFIDDQMQETDYDTLINKYNNTDNDNTMTTATTTINDSSTPSLSSSYSDLSSWDTDDSEREYFFDCYDYDYTFSPNLNSFNNTTTTATATNSITGTSSTTTSDTITTDDYNNPYKYNNFLTKTNSTDTLLCFDKRWDDREYTYNNESNYLDNEDNETITSMNEIGNSTTNIATFDLTYDYCDVQL